MATLTDHEFVALLEQHRDEFWRYVVRNVWHPDSAEDVMAGAVQAAYRQLDRFEKGTNFRAWMYRILTNKCFVANRETKRAGVDIETLDESLFAVDDEAQRRATTDPQLFLQQCGDELHSALRQLSTAERSCLLLLAVEHYSYKEIAAILEMPVGTVMTHLARGRAKLRRLLADYARRQGVLPASPALRPDDRREPLIGRAS
jgi:RNA polymerase sigma-70 factor (ECF subfamily)